MKEITRAHSLVGFRPEDRPDNDFYPTPVPTTEALLNVESFDGGIWECACGDGAMANVMERYGYDVYGSDIEPRGYGRCLDFFAAADLMAPNIVTNPPFSLFNEFIVKAHSFQPKKIALLAKLQALETIERSYILEETNLTRVWIFRARQTIWRNGHAATNNKGMIAFCWLVWERGYQGKPEIGWL